MGKKKDGKWDDKQQKYDSDDDPTRLKHDPYHITPHQREYVHTFHCECCNNPVTLRGADKTQVELALLNLRRYTGGHELCDECIAAGVRHFNLKERKVLFQKTGRRS